MNSLKQYVQKFLDLGYPVYVGVDLKPVPRVSSSLTMSSAVLLQPNTQAPEGDYCWGYCDFECEDK